PAPPPRPPPAASAAPAAAGVPPSPRPVPAARSGAYASTSTATDTIAGTWSRRRGGRFGFRIAVIKLTRVRWEQNRICIERSRHRQGWILDYGWMRVGRDHLWNPEISLRQLAERCWCLLFTTAAATAARFLLFRLATATSSLGHAGGAFVRRRLLVWNIRNHLCQFQIILVCQLGRFGLLVPIPEECPTDDNEQQCKTRDDAGQDVPRVRRSSPHNCPAATAEPGPENSEQSAETDYRDDNHRLTRRSGPRAIEQENSSHHDDHRCHEKQHRYHYVAAPKESANHSSIALDRTLREAKGIAFELRPG